MNDFQVELPSTGINKKISVESLMEEIKLVIS